MVQDNDIMPNQRTVGQPDILAQRRGARELTELAQRTALVTGIGVLAILATAVFGHADTAVSIFAAAILGFAGLLVYLNAKPEIEAEAARVEAAAPAKIGASWDLTLRQVLGALPDAAFAIDRDGRLEGANARARKHFSLPPVGQRLATSLRDPRLLEAALEVAAGGEPQSVPFAAVGPLEEYFRAQIGGFDVDGKRFALIVVHDETNAKKVERMRVDFLANASHELRTPLAAVVGSIETLTGHARNDPAAQERFLKVMQIQADRMRRLIDDLLSLSKIELNEHVPPQGEVDMDAVVRETVDTLAPISARKNVRIDVIRAEGDSMVLGNRDELVQVAQNLIDNAVKYAREGGQVNVEIGGGLLRENIGLAARRWPDAAHMSIAAPPVEPDKTLCYVRVTDDGPGMPRESLPRLSQRFYRVEEAKNSDRVGTGLGLAIVKHIINRHRGGFFVESRLGSGSSFTVCVQNADKNQH
ncbi:MAG: ATP-binding protein [Caulobacterales bacterium]